MASLMEYFMGQGGQPTMADLLREPGGAAWLDHLYALTQMLDRPTAWGAPDQVQNFQPQARGITDPELFAGWDPRMYGQAAPQDNRDVVLRAPQSEWVNTMPKSWFSSDPSMAGALRDRQIRDQRLLGIEGYSGNRDPNLSVLQKSGAGGM